MEVNESENVEVENQDTNEELSIGSLDDLRNIDLSEEVLAESDENAGEDQVEPEAQEDQDAPEYSPDYTYKVKDEVLEFNDDLRQAVSSKEVEDHLRDLYTRAAGLDGYKDKYSTLEGKYNEQTPQLERMIGGYKNLMDLRDKGDMDRLTGVLGITEEQLLDHAEELLKRQELPEDQRKAITENRELSDKYNHLESQFQALQNEQVNGRVDAEKQELNNLLTTNEDFSNCNEQLKSIGIDFQQDVISAGDAIVANENRYPTVLEAIQKAYELRQPLMERLNGTQTKQEEPVVQTEKVVERQPTLPKVRGSNSNKVEEVMTFDKLVALQKQIPTN